MNKNSFNSFATAKTAAKLKKSAITGIFALTAAAIFSSCSIDADGPGTSSSSGSSQKSTGSFTANTSSRNIATDDTATVSFSNTIYIDVSTPSFGTDGSNWNSLTDKIGTETTVLTDSDNKNITILYDSSNGITLNTSNSSQSVQVVLSGTSTQCHMIFKNKKNVAFGVKLNGIKIPSYSFPAITFDKKSSVYLQIEGSNTIIDGRSFGYGYGAKYSTSTSNTYTDSDGNTQNCTVSANPVSTGDDTKGTIYTKGPLLISGSGSLTLEENYKHGIYSKDYIRIFGGTITITSSGRNGIQCVNGFIMDDGTITITGTGTNTNNQSRGIIVEGEENSEGYAGEGYVLINGGTVNITTVSKGIAAKWDIDEDASTSATTDDPYPYVKITGGTVTVKTTGTPADESKSTYTFTDADGVSVTESTKLSPEGIEGKQSIFITGGTVEVTTTDDCLNASRSGNASLEISGGKVYAYSSGNDAIDSNGTLTISGGTIVAMTSTTPECAFDCDSYTFSITGGTFIGIGTTNYSAPTASACSQSTVVLSGDYLGSSGTIFTLGTSATNPVFAYKIDSSIFSSMSKSYIAIISSPSIEKGTSYSLFTGASVSDGETFHNLYTSMPAVSSATTKTTGITTSSSSAVYTLSSSSNGGAQEGSHGNPQDGTQTGGSTRR